MGVNYVYIPRSHSRADSTSRSYIPIGRHRDGAHGKPCGASLLYQRRSGGADEKGLMTKIPEPQREKQNLSLSSPPRRAGVEVKNP